MTPRVLDGVAWASGWIEVEEGRYRYALDSSSGIAVRTLIWDYLATETHSAP